MVLNSVPLLSSSSLLWLAAFFPSSSDCSFLILSIFFGYPLKQKLRNSPGEIIFQDIHNKRSMFCKSSFFPEEPVHLMGSQASYNICQSLMDPHNWQTSDPNHFFYAHIFFHQDGSTQYIKISNLQLWRCNKISNRYPKATHIFTKTF